MSIPTLSGILDNANNLQSYYVLKDNAFILTKISLWERIWRCFLSIFGATSTQEVSIGKSLASLTQFLEADKAATQQWLKNNQETFKQPNLPANVVVIIQAAIQTLAVKHGYTQLFGNALKSLAKSF
jgi:hypothetical protein